MELTETIDRINEQLKNEYGIETTSSRPIYRVVWANDQLEKRLSKFSPRGIEYLRPQLIEVPKYRQWAKDRYILERLSYVDSTLDSKEMTVHRISYEPVWSFVDKDLNYLPPKWEVCKIIIDTIHAAIYSDHSLAKYKDPGESLEEHEVKIAKIQQELFGNETEVGDALAHKEAVIVPRNFESEKVN